MTKKQHLYWSWVKAEAKKINSDGCTVVSKLYRLIDKAYKLVKKTDKHISEAYKVCCGEHDLAYWYAKDPRSAYRLYRDVPDSNYWYFADTVDRSEADKRFRSCIQIRSKLGKASPVSWVRWLGTRAGGWKPWRDHRKKGHNAT